MPRRANRMGAVGLAVATVAGLSAVLATGDGPDHSVAGVAGTSSGATGVTASAGRTLCGAAFVGESAGETYQQALAREDRYFGGLEMVRTYYPGLPRAWPGKVHTNGRPINVSFKARPSEVIQGKHDAALRTWFRTAPRDQTVYWTYYHEPEDNIAKGEFTAAQFRKAFQHISTLADEARNPRLRATLILMGWTVDPQSKRNWRSYYPGRAHVDVFGWDAYNEGRKKGTYDTPEQTFRKPIEVSRGEKLPFAIAETGSTIVRGDNGSRRAKWLRDSTAYLAGQGAEFVAYFDIDWTRQSGDDFRLRDRAGKAAWKKFCAS